MKIEQTGLPGVLVIEPRVFRDDRGYFLESFHRERFAEHGLPTEFVQDNQSRSTRGVLRGLHYQLRRPQGKLITCIRGEIFDVAVDIRRGSPTFGRWVSVTLTGDDPRVLWIPEGFAHGFVTLSDEADVVYKCTAPYDATDDRGILWCDPALDIKWPGSGFRLSPRDERQPTLAEAMDQLPVLEHQ